MYPVSSGSFVGLYFSSEQGFELNINISMHEHELGIVGGGPK